MTIEERLTVLLSGVSPWGKSYYTVFGLQGGPTPFVVARKIAQMPILSHTNPLPGTRVWHYEFSLYSPDGGYELNTAADVLRRKIIGFREASPGIKAALMIDESDLYEEETKLYSKHIEVELTEDLV